MFGCTAIANHAKNIFKASNQFYFDLIQLFWDSNIYNQWFVAKTLQNVKWSKILIWCEFPLWRLPIWINRKTSKSIPLYFSKMKSGRHWNCSRRYLWNWNLYRFGSNLVLREFLIWYESVALRLPIDINRKTSRGIPFNFSEIKSGRNRNYSLRDLWNWNFRFFLAKKTVLYQIAGTLLNARKNAQFLVK